MKQVMIRQGQSVVEEVPAPQAEKGRVLVQVDHSCISPGTELSAVQASGQPLWKQALKNPNKVKKALEMVMTQGFKKTKSVVDGKQLAGNPTGYSAAGRVLQVGEGITDLRVGDRVACAGAQCAHHAEVISVPRNLTVAIPEALSSAHASTVTMGAIALQGVRRAKPTLGETFVVIGLGLLGQLTVQLLKVNGCHVIGIDLDAQRNALAEELGIERTFQVSDPLEIGRLTDGHGADGVIITAASTSHSIISDAFNLCRRKGRVVLVGDVGLNLKRADFYQKEIDFFISTSYGPGRYDSSYEEKGIDYPISYVRWTENRNMSSYLDLLAKGMVKVDALIEKIYPIDQAGEAFEALKTLSPKPLGLLLAYAQAELSHTITTPSIRVKKGELINVAVIGAGSFAKGVHLPHLESLDRYFRIAAVVSRSGHNAATTAKQFKAPIASTSFEEVIENPDIDALIITTRHDLHKNMALAGLKAGKHLLLEKPLCIHREELEEIKSYFAEAKETPLLLTGFNRRFSPSIAKIKKDLKGPMIINYRMNAGFIPKEHWVHQEEGGGRNIGEACHIYDLFTYLTGSRVVEINAQSISPRSEKFQINENFVATMQFEDGSLATLTYTSLGSKSYPKELMEIYVDGKVLHLDEYKKSKGQREELQAFGDAILSGSEWPIPLWQQIQATEISLSVEEQLTKGQYVRD
ncbi:MAG: 4-carboxy-2-hydroxymuconate-6-semialdehyde dehydrogenase [Chlamydiae bacterium]|nr:4-carboxy-2-hydroxymuconate-6-semialdehyde dehydrogenase [Chlamydiota bacterium]